MSRDNSENKRLKDNTRNFYSDWIYDFLYGLGPVKDIQLEDIKRHLDRMSDSTKNRTSSAIKGFLKFTKLPLPFDINDIPREKKPNQKNKAEPISLNQMIQLRNVLLKEKEYRHLFILEMVYVNNLNLGEILKCKKDNYDYENHCFTFKEPCIYTSSIVNELIDIVGLDVLEPRVSKNQIQSYISSMEKYINRNLKWQDIKASSGMHSMKCPICQRPFICESDYWCLVRSDNDVRGIARLVCKGCAERL